MKFPLLPEWTQTYFNLTTGSLAEDKWTSKLSPNPVAILIKCLDSWLKASGTFFNGKNLPVMYKERNQEDDTFPLTLTCQGHLKVSTEDCSFEAHVAPIKVGKFTCSNLLWWLWWTRHKCLWTCNGPFHLISTLSQTWLHKSYLCSNSPMWAHHLSSSSTAVHLVHTCILSVQTVATQFEHTLSTA